MAFAVWGWGLFEPPIFFVFFSASSCMLSWMDGAKIFKPSCDFAASRGSRLAALKRLADQLPPPQVGLRRLRAVISASSRVSAERLQKCAGSKNLAQGSSHLGVKPFGWFWPTEPQMTFALAEQLDHEDKRTRLERCNALLRAVAHSRPIGARDTNSSEPLSFTAVTEVSAERSTEAGKFIDLLVAGRSGGKQFECVIEAKLGQQ